MMRGASRANSPIILAQSGVPVGIPAAGTVATNGTITFGVAFPNAYAGIWLFLPANAIVGGLAGFYWATTIGASTTNFQFTTAFLASITVPQIPTGFSNAVGSNAAYTQTTSVVAATGFTLPGGLLGPNGVFRTQFRVASSNSAVTKKWDHTIGSVSLMTRSPTTQITAAPSL